MSITWTERTFPLSKLKAYERNPRKISPEQLNQLKKYIEEDGFHQRLLVTKDGEVIGGHQRIKALKALGWKEVACLVPDQDLSAEEVKRLLIRDNLQAGEWDFSIMAEDFSSEELSEFGLPQDLVDDIFKEPKLDDEKDADSQDAPEVEQDDSVTCGVVVMCKDEEEQHKITQKLREDGYTAYVAKGSVKIK